MNTRGRRILVLALLTAGCAGPQAHVSLNGKAVALDVAFGNPGGAVSTKAPLAPVPGGVGVLPVKGNGGARVIIRYVGGRPGQHPLAPPAAPPCQANPASVPALVAGDSVQKPATAGTFPYRFSGESVDGHTLRKFKGVAMHKVTSSSVGGGAYRYDVTVQMLGATTTFSYVVTPPFASIQTLPGSIELARVTGDGGFGYVASFRPTKPIEVFTQPAFTGATWKDAGADGSSGTVATVSGTVEGKDAVNACGKNLDAWRTTTTVTMKSANENITATLSTWWGTQFGGIPLAESQSYTGTAGGKTVKGTLTSTINVDPSKVAS